MLILRFVVGIVVILLALAMYLLSVWERWYEVARPFLIWLILAILLLLAAILEGSQFPTVRDKNGETIVRLEVFPRIVMAGMGRGQVFLQASGPSHEDNRFVSLSFEGDNGTAHSSSKSLNGVKEPVNFPMCFSKRDRACWFEVTSGHYLVVACVHRVQEGKAELKGNCVTQELEVR